MKIHQSTASAALSAVVDDVSIDASAAVDGTAKCDQEFTQ
jgi:hypothetical protein